MTRNALFCLAISFALVALSFSYSFGALSWYADKFSSDPLGTSIISVGYPVVLWAVIRMVVDIHDHEEDLGAFAVVFGWFSLFVPGGMHFALLGWLDFFRSGLTITGDSTVSIPVAGAVMIILSVTLTSYCVASHIARRRNDLNGVAAFVLCMSMLHGLAMIFVQSHALPIHVSAQTERLIGNTGDVTKRE